MNNVEAWLRLLTSKDLGAVPATLDPLDIERAGRIARTDSTIAPEIRIIICNAALVLAWSIRFFRDFHEYNRPGKMATTDPTMQCVLYADDMQSHPGRFTTESGCPYTSRYDRIIVPCYVLGFRGEGDEDNEDMQAHVVRAVQWLRRVFIFSDTCDHAREVKFNLYTRIRPLLEECYGHSVETYHRMVREWNEREKAAIQEEQRSLHRLRLRECREHRELADAAMALDVPEHVTVDIFQDRMRAWREHANTNNIDPWRFMLVKDRYLRAMLSGSLFFNLAPEDFQRQKRNRRYGNVNTHIRWMRAQIDAGVLVRKDDAFTLTGPHADHVHAIMQALRPKTVSH